MTRTREVAFVLCGLVLGGVLIASNYVTSGNQHVQRYTMIPDDGRGVVSRRGTDSPTTTKNPKVAIILFWTLFYDMKNWQVDAGPVTCGPYTCYLTYDKKQYHNASAVMIHHRSKDGWGGWAKMFPHKNLPRIPGQRWVLYNRESTWWGPGGSVLNGANNWINWTMGFRSDDDITIPSATLSRGRFEDGFDPNGNYLDGKTGDIAALMSMVCRTKPVGHATRRKYLETLQKHGLKFDMYGKCGKDCGAFSSCSAILQKYKFFLAFENSLCDEYISEKPYRNGFMLGVVPVIMSAANLSDPYILPPGSFIDASQFTSVSALSNFLKSVGSDPKRYNKYFEWRNYWNIKLNSINEGQEKFSRDYFCPLCRRLHEDQRPKFISNVQEWYEQEKCKEFPQMNP